MTISPLQTLALARLDKLTKDTLGCPNSPQLTTSILSPQHLSKKEFEWPLDFTSSMHLFHFTFSPFNSRLTVLTFGVLALPLVTKYI